MLTIIELPTLQHIATRRLEITTGFSFGSLLNDGLLDTPSLRQGNLGMISASNHKDVGLSGREGVALPVLDGDDGKRSIMLLNMLKGSNTTSVVSSRNHDHGANFELVDVRHLASGNIHLNSVIYSHVGVRETKSPAVMGDSNRYLLGTHVPLLNAAKLVLRLVLLNAVEHKASLGIVEETEEIPTLLEGDNIHKTGGVVVISADLSVNLDTTLHANLLAFLSSQSVLETLSEDDGNRETLALLMGSLAGLWGPHTTHFAEIPVAGRIEALEMFLRSARPIHQGATNK